MIKSIFIFDEAGALLFHDDVTRDRSDPKLVSAFLSATDQWAKMYSNTGVSLFMTGTMKFTFERSIYARDLIFCIASSLDHDEAELMELIQVIRENFVHVFWEDLDRFNRGVSRDKIDQFKQTIMPVLKKEG